jgi:hypothetical protein
MKVRVTSRHIIVKFQEAGGKGHILRMKNFNDIRLLSSNIANWINTMSPKLRNYLPDYIHYSAKLLNLSMNWIHFQTHEIFWKVTLFAFFSLHSSSRNSWKIWVRKTKEQNQEREQLGIPHRKVEKTAPQMMEVLILFHWTLRLLPIL